MKGPRTGAGALRACRDGGRVLGKEEDGRDSGLDDPSHKSRDGVDAAHDAAGERRGAPARGARDDPRARLDDRRARPVRRARDVAPPRPRERAGRRRAGAVRHPRGRAAQRPRPGPGRLPCAAQWGLTPDGMTISTLGLTAERAAAMLDARELSCEELAAAYLERIEADADTGA